MAQRTIRVWRTNDACRQESRSHDTVSRAHVGRAFRAQAMMSRGRASASASHGAATRSLVALSPLASSSATRSLLIRGVASSHAVERCRRRVHLFHSPPR
jgi:hypothetical protein